METTPKTPMRALPAAIINALVTDQGVNLGDHGQDITRAVAVEATETNRTLED